MHVTIKKKKTMKCSLKDHSVIYLQCLLFCAVYLIEVKYCCEILVWLLSLELFIITLPWGLLTVSLYCTDMLFNGFQKILC